MFQKSNKAWSQNVQMMLILLLGFLIVACGGESVTDVVQEAANNVAEDIAVEVQEAASNVAEDIAVEVQEAASNVVEDISTNVEEAIDTASNLSIEEMEETAVAVAQEMAVQAEEQIGTIVENAEARVTQAVIDQEETAEAAAPLDSAEKATTLEAFGFSISLPEGMVEKDFMTMPMGEGMTLSRTTYDAPTLKITDGEAHFDAVFAELDFQSVGGMVSMRNYAQDNYLASIMFTGDQVLITITEKEGIGTGLLEE